MKSNEYQSSRSFFDSDARSLRFQSLNLFFSKTVDAFETKFHINAYGNTEMKMYANGLSHMTKLAAMPIYDKNFKNLLLQNQLTDGLGTWYEVLST